MHFNSQFQTFLVVNQVVHANPRRITQTLQHAQKSLGEKIDVEVLQIHSKIKLAPVVSGFFGRNVGCKKFVQT